ncbi:MAG: hypothetical protein JSW60_09305, partial [Thermoplasmatales archaeon]
MTVHNSTRQLERAIFQIDNAKTSEHNKKFIKQFIRFLSAQGVKELRQVKYIYSLQKITSWLNKDFDKATKLDIIDLCNNIEKNGYSDWTKHDYRVTI